MENQKGVLYGIGTGPGDPELLTLKAIRTVEHCPVIAVPKSVGKASNQSADQSGTKSADQSGAKSAGHSGGGEGTAFAIVEPYLAGKELIECRFVMERDMQKRRAARQLAADQIIQYLKRGQDVGFITLGDPTTYSTYMYIHQLVVDAGYTAKIIPGITSFAAAAAELGVALCEDSEPLTVIPASHNASIDELLDATGTKVIMKSASSLADVLSRLRTRGLNEQTKIVYQATMPGQRLYHSLDEYEQAPESGYFTLAIVKEKRP